MSRRLKPYPGYKDSGVEWLGRIPADWETWKLAHAFGEIGSGTTPNTGKESYFDGDIPWVTTSELRERVITDTETKLSNQAVLDHSALKIYAPGTLLFAMYGATIGRLGILGIPACVNQACCALGRSKVVQTRYAYFALWATRQQLISLASGGGQPNVNQEKLRAFKLPVPSSDEQQAIAGFLDRETGKIDALVKKKERLIELLQEKRTALISHAVTQGLNPNAPKTDSEIPWFGHIPAHWEIKRLSTVCGFEQGKAHEPFVDDAGEFICVNSRFISTEGASVKFCRVNLTPAKLNDILMVMSDLPNGRALAKAYFVNDGCKYAVNQRVCRLTAHKAHPRFLFYQLNRNEFFLQHDDGANQTHLYNGLFTKFPALLPPLGEQSAIADFLDRETAKLDALMAKVQTAIERLQEYRTALISAAVTGQIDVRQISSRPGSTQTDSTSR